MAFSTEKIFPAKYQGGILVAAHGSWNCSPASVALINDVSLKADGKADKSEIIVDGWLSQATGTYIGRPVDVAMLKDGSLLISDDYVGANYRVIYNN